MLTLIGPVTHARLGCTCTKCRIPFVLVVNVPCIAERAKQMECSSQRTIPTARRRSNTGDRVQISMEPWVQRLIRQCWRRGLNRSSETGGVWMAFKLQHDGTQTRFALSVRDVLKELFPDCWVGRGSPTTLVPLTWPPRSPDLATPNNSLWSLLQGKSGCVVDYGQLKYVIHVCKARSVRFKVTDHWALYLDQLSEILGLKGWHARHIWSNYDKFEIL